MPSNRLEQAAIAARDGLIASNTYNSVNQANNYGATHTRALSDQATPVYGKGNPNAPLGHALGGGFYAVDGAVGGDLDINGNPSAVGSGRIQNVATNQYVYLNQYQAPDTSGNVGQVILP